jgi:hypothetical protein
VKTRAKSTWRAIHASLWGEEWFRKLPPSEPSARLLWFHLKTGPHVTSLECLYRAGEAALADEMGWTLEGFRECWGELERAGKVRADWSARVVWLPREMGDGDPANPNVIVGWSRLVPAIPECGLKDEACKAIAAHCLRRAPREKLTAWRDAVRRVFGEDTVSDTPPHTVSDTVWDTPPETKTKTRSKNNTKTPPPAPSGGNAGGGAFQEEEDRTTKARSMVCAYVVAAGVEHCSSEAAVPVVAAHLAAGVPEAELRLAGETYAAGEVRAASDPRKRFGPTTFFKGEWQKFRNGPPKPPPVKAFVPPRLPERTPEELAEAERKRAARLARAAAKGDVTRDASVTKA